MKNCIYVFVLVGCLMASGCAIKEADHVAVRTGSPVVHIYPLGGQYEQASALVLPFQVPEGTNPSYGQQVGALFHEVFLSKQTFTEVRFDERFYGNIDEAMEMGRQAGVDLVVAGRINYVMSGGQLGGARVDVSLRLLNVKSGNTVWFISQVMDQLLDHPDVSLPNRLFSAFSLQKVRSSTGAATLPNMLAHIAVDMSDVMAGSRLVSRKMR
ncbi:MAG: penicillin-binding protein activator LpoB [Proteobacteria bacterium]|nr:penicillin-binding protein activator LpoB [Pseudomonadota bacterium]